MNKEWLKYVLVMIVAFMLDSCISYFLPFDYGKSAITIVPCIGLMMFMLLNNTVDNEFQYVFAVIVGAYYAIIYANSLAIYVLLYVVFSFFGRQYTKLSTFSIFESFLIFALTIFVQLSVVYWLMKGTGITSIGVISFIYQRLLPSLLFNMILTIPVFFVHKKLGFEVKVNAH